MVKPLTYIVEKLRSDQSAHLLVSARTGPDLGFSTTYVNGFMFRQGTLIRLY